MDHRDISHCILWTCTYLRVQLQESPQIIATFGVIPWLLVGWTALRWLYAKAIPIIGSKPNLIQLWSKYQLNYRLHPLASNLRTLNILLARLARPHHVWMDDKSWLSELDLQILNQRILFIVDNGRILRNPMVLLIVKSCRFHRALRNGNAPSYRIQNLSENMSAAPLKEGAPKPKDILGPSWDQVSIHWNSMKILVRSK